MFGFILLIIGVIWLLEAAGVVGGGIWAFIWPIAVIIVSLSILMGKKKGCCFCGDKKKE